MRKKKLWAFYVWTMQANNGHSIHHFEQVGTSTSWRPNAQFDKLAAKLKYLRFVRDTSLIIGGYYANNKGDCLIMVPFGSDPYQMHA